MLSNTICNKNFKFLLLTVTCLVFHRINGQVLYPNHDLIDYYKTLELTNPEMDQRINLFPSVLSQYDKDSLNWNIWNVQFTDFSNSNFQILPTSLSFTYNSKYARGYNDGAVWQGKGLNSVLHGGVSGKKGILEYTFSPVIYFSQNQHFELAPTASTNAPYNYAFNQNIDFVQRYGDNPFTSFDWGQSDLRMVFNWFTIGVSTQNMTWGPAQVNPILMGNNAAGIPRIDLGTNKPVSTKIGNIEGKFFWGVLRESSYFDNISNNDSRYWTGITLGYSPKFIQGLHLGFNRAFYKRGEEFSPSDLLITFWRFNNPQDDPSVNDEYDQMGSVTVRWSFSEVGFETYFEFAKNDFGSSFVGLDPEHSRGYTLGMIKLIKLKNNELIKLSYEHTSVDRAKTAVLKPHNHWFTHTTVNQGYTNKGQIISTGIGPGSTTDHFGLQYYFKTGRIDATAQRIRFNDDYFYASVNDHDLRDHEWTGTVKYLRIWKQNKIDFTFGISYRENMYYVENTQVNIVAGITFTRSIK